MGWYFAVVTVDVNIWLKGPIVFKLKENSCHSLQLTHTYEKMGAVSFNNRSLPPAAYTVHKRLSNRDKEKKISTGFVHKNLFHDQTLNIPKLKLLLHLGINF